jgi:hypothetical protein
MQPIAGTSFDDTVAEVSPFLGGDIHPDPEAHLDTFDRELVLGVALLSVGALVCTVLCVIGAPQQGWWQANLAHNYSMSYGLLSRCLLPPTVAHGHLNSSITTSVTTLCNSYAAYTNSTDYDSLLTLNATGLIPLPSMGTVAFSSFLVYCLLALPLFLSAVVLSSCSWLGLIRTRWTVSAALACCVAGSVASVAPSFCMLNELLHGTFVAGQRPAVYHAQIVSFIGPAS